MNKYGVDNFKFEILEETCQPEERERYYIQFYDTYNNGYNETLGGDGRQYLILPEKDICQFYLKTKSVKKTAKHYGHDYLTIQQILHKNNIQILSATEIIQLLRTKKVAKIDKNTNQIIEIYPSINDAERKNGNNRHIAQVCNGKRRSAYGYY